MYVIFWSCCSINSKIESSDLQSFYARSGFRTERRAAEKGPGGRPWRPVLLSLAMWVEVTYTHAQDSAFLEHGTSSESAALAETRRKCSAACPHSIPCNRHARTHNVLSKDPQARVSSKEVSFTCCSYRCIKSPLHSQAKAQRSLGHRWSPR